MLILADTGARKPEIGASARTGTVTNQPNKAINEEPPLSVERKIFGSVKLVVLSLLVIAGGVLIGAYLGGWIDLPQQVARIPGVGKLIDPGQTDSAPIVTGMSLMEKENLELKRKVQEQQDLVQGILEEKQAQNRTRWFWSRGLGIRE